MSNYDINISSSIRKYARILSGSTDISPMISLLSACSLIQEERLRNSCIYFVLSNLTNLKPIVSIEPTV